MKIKIVVYIRIFASDNKLWPLFNETKMQTQKL